MTSLSLYLLTFNCARAQNDPEVVAAHLFQALPNSQIMPDILVLSLQEIAPIAQSFLGGSFLDPFFNGVRRGVELAGKNTTYSNIITRNVGMTAIMIFIRASLVPQISWVRVAGIGVGVQGMGNKGAVGVRLGLTTEEDESVQMTFVSAHLAPMEDGLKRRNRDWKHIVEGMVFVPESSDKSEPRDGRSEDVPLLEGFAEGGPGATGMYTPKTYLFVAGDLNYRVSEVGPTAADVKHFPRPTNDMNDPQHFSHLLVRDQLKQQLRAGKTLHNLTEAPITFPPTYKYLHDPSGALQDDNSEEWKWAIHRWPSWCDRILYLDLPNWTHEAVSAPRIEIHNYKALPLFPTSDHRPVVLSVSIPLAAMQEPPAFENHLEALSPFTIDGEWKGKRDLARKKEIFVGVLAYLGSTWEGSGLLLGTLLGGIGAWLIVRSLMAV